MRIRVPASHTAALLLSAIGLSLAIAGPETIVAGGDAPGPKPLAPALANEPNRSPIALALSADGTRLLIANQGSGTVSLVDTTSARVLHELKTGDKPAGVALSRDGRRGVVTHWYGYDLALLELKDDKLAVAGRIEVGPEPRGVAITPDGSTAFVAVGVSNEIVRVDLNNLKLTGHLPVGREPRSVALAPDGSRLLVSNARSQDVSIIDPRNWSVVQTVPIDGDNLRQVAISSDSKMGYVANMRNRRFPTTKNNIDLGWVLGQRLTRVPLDKSGSYETLTLDIQGKAASDAHGVAVSPDLKFVAVSCGGTHEVMIFRTDLKRLPWRPEQLARFDRAGVAPEGRQTPARARRGTSHGAGLRVR